MQRRIGFLVTHGTDTMAWTLAYLSYRLHGYRFNIVLTGSQRPLEVALAPTDGYDNLDAAIQVLRRMPPPGVYCAFNRGRTVFAHSLTKVDCWDDDAFCGHVVADLSDGVWRGLPEYAGTATEVLLLASGGTIDSGWEHGVLRVGRNTVSAYLSNRYPDLTLRPVPLEDRIDSSDVSPAWWKSLGDAIVEAARGLGLACEHAPRLDQGVRILTASPLASAEDYERLFDGASGLILLGYGAANVPSRWRDRSPLPAIERAARREPFVPVVVGTQAPRGLPDPVYETGWRALCAGGWPSDVLGGRATGTRPLALPIGDFGVARAQIKLATILAHRVELEEAARRWGGEQPYRRILAGLFLSGMRFRSSDRRPLFEALYGVRIPPRDLLLGRSVSEALESLSRYQDERPPVVLSATRDSLEDEPAHGAARDRAGLLKPDATVGNDVWGFPTDASHYAVEFLRQAFGWTVESYDLYTWEELAHPNASMAEELAAHLAARLREHRLLLGEGGNQSATDPHSFERVGVGVSLDWWTRLFRELIRLRATSPGAAPGIFLCLSHQLYAQALAALVGDALRRVPVELARGDATLRAAWQEAIDPWLPELEWVHEDSVIEKVRSAGAGRRGLAPLSPYRPSEGIPEALADVHARAARRLTGYVEQLIACDDIAVTTMHGDAIDERRLLALNAFFVSATQFRRAHWSRLQAVVPACAEILRGLPVAVEVTASTVSGGHATTEVASTAVYFSRPEGGPTWRDLTFQFHPELPLPADAFHHIGTGTAVAVRFDNDGHKLLLGAILALLTEQQVCLEAAR